MKTLNSIVEGFFDDADDSLDQLGKENSIEKFFEDKRIKCKIDVDKNKMILDFSEEPGYVHVDFKVFDRMNFTGTGINQIIIKGKSDNTQFILHCDHSSGFIDGKKGFVEDLYIEGTIYEINGSLGAKLRNTTLHSRFFGNNRLDQIKAGWFDGCSFECDSIWVDFAGNEKCTFDIDCKNLNIIHNEETESWPELTDMTLVMARDKSFRTEAEGMWDLRTSAFPKDKFWINFNGRSGAEVYKEFFKNHFSKVKFDKLKIDYCKNRGYGNYWHVYINCNGKTWSSTYYGR